MTTVLPEQDQVLNAIRTVADVLGRPPSRAEFRSSSGMSEYQVLKHFPSWREAVKAAGLAPNSTNQPIEPDALLEDWGELVRRARRIPTRRQYQQDGTFSAGVFERRFGPWSTIPSRFRGFAQGKIKWADVMALLPIEDARQLISTTPLRPPVHSLLVRNGEKPCEHTHLHNKLGGRPTYGNPLDFRGLRHEPVNEQGVVFLFGMVARELGYLVEAVQTGYPDCEAKRQVGPGKWQRVRIEFEFESRNFRDHGHPQSGCDVIVCWRHNWSECPKHLEVVELSSLIRTLSASED